MELSHFLDELDEKQGVDIAPSNRTDYNPVALELYG